MSDPLSIAGSLAGLAQLTASTFIAVFKYVKDVQSAKDEIGILAKEIRNFYGIVQNLYLLATGLDQTNSHQPILQGSQIMLCTETLSRIDREIDKASKYFRSGSLKSKARSLKWPFSKDETHELLQELERHKSAVNTALAADTVGLLMQSLGLQQKTRDEIDTVKNAIEKLENIQAQFVRDEKKKDMERFFLRVNPMHSLQSNIKLKQKDTGSWFHQSYQVLKWIEVPNSKLWLSGIPGSGKSVMCASLIERIIHHCNGEISDGNRDSIIGSSAIAATKREVVCFFFCDYKIPESQRLVNLLQVLAIQLARYHQDAFNILQKYFESLQHGSSLEREPESLALLDLVLLMCQSFSKVFIIVDAIDECDKHSVDVVRGLKHLAMNAPNVSMALFSRNELRLRQELCESYSHMEVAAHTEDLELFVSAEMLRRLALSQLAPTESKEIRRTLVSKSQGMFRWVVCQLDYLQELGAVARTRALNGLPPTLNETYDRILQGQISGANNAFTRSLARKTLHCICSAGNCISIAELCIAVSINHEKDFIDQADIVGEAEVLHACSSLVRKNSHSLKLAHLSVKEYLQGIDPNGPLGEFSHSKETPSTWLASTCIRYLTFKDFRRHTRNTFDGWLAVKQRNEEYPFYAFAASFWLTLYGPSGSTHLQPSERLKLLFNPRRKVYLQNWFIQYLMSAYLANYSRSDAELFQVLATYVIRQDVTPLHVAASLGLHSVCSWLLHAGVSVDARSEVGTPLGCALAGPRVFLDGLIHFNKIANPKDIRLTVDLLMKHKADLAVPSTDDSFSCQALQLCLQIDSSLPLIPFIQTPFAVCDDLIPWLKESKHPWYRSEGILKEIFQEVLDADAEANEDDRHLANVASYVRTEILSKGDWDHYENIRGSFTSDIIKDGDFHDYVAAAAAQNRADEMVKLIADKRFPTLGMMANPLLVAILACNCDVIKVLLSSDMDFKGYMQRYGLPSPLHECTTDELLPALRLVLGAGFDHLEFTPAIRRESSWPNSGYTIWHLAAAANALEILKALLKLEDRRVEALRTLSSSGRTPLAEAIGRMNKSAALLLLKECPEGEMDYFKSDQPVLHLAAQLGSDRLYRGLLQKGVTADLDSVDGSTPLHHINQRVSLKLLRRLLSTYGLGKKRADGQTAAQLFLLHLKSEIYTFPFLHNKSGLVAQEILDTLFGETPVRAGTDDDNTPIWEFFCRSVIEPPDLEAQGEKGWVVGEMVIVPTLKAIIAGTGNALMDYTACRHQSPTIPLFQALVKLHPPDLRKAWVCEVVERTIQALSDPTGYRDTSSAITLLKAAVEYGHLKVVRSLMANGWDVFRREGLSCALEVACQFSSLEILTAVLSPTDRHRLTETATMADLDLVGNIMASPAAYIPPKIRYMLMQGLDPNNTTTEGGIKYPWVVAAADANRFDIVALLQEYGADIFAQTADGLDVAKLAALRRDLDMLLKIWAAAAKSPGKYDWNSRQSLVIRRSDSGMGKRIQRHILHFAAEGGQTEVLRFLLDNNILPSAQDGGIDVLDGNGLTPFQVAQTERQYEACDFLAQRGATVPELQPQEPENHEVSKVLRRRSI